MDIVVVLAGTAIILMIGNLIFARWGSGYARRFGDEYWKQINRSSDSQEDEHYR